MSDNQVKNKAIPTIVGIVLGLLIATSVYLFFENKELKESILTNQNEVESLNQPPNSSNNNKPESSAKTLEKEEVQTNIEEPSRQEITWEITKNTNTFDGYLQFIKSEDNEGNYNKESISKLFEFGRSGWLYSGRTDGDGTYSSDQMVEVVWRKNSNKNLKNLLPEEGDLVKLISKQPRRTYPDFLPRNQQNGIWDMESHAFVLDTRMEGKSAVILKVVYKK